MITSLGVFRPLQSSCVKYLNRYTERMQQQMISPERAKLNIAENLRSLMDNAGITQLQVAAGANISQSFVHKMLHGKILPNAVALRNVAEVLGVSTDRLIDNPPENNSGNLFKAS